MPVVTLSSKGQLVLPQEMRRALGLQKGDRRSITLEDDRLVLKRVMPEPKRHWQCWRGSLAGTQALQEHLAEHAHEVDRECLS